MTITIDKKKGKIVADKVQQLMADASAKSTGYMYPESFWKGYIESGLKHLIIELESGLIISN